MNSVSAFRGMAGDIVYEFITWKTFLTLFPILVAWLILIFLINIFQIKMPLSVYYIITLLASSWFTSRFAIPASRGELNAGLFSTLIGKGETLALMNRYCILLLVWGIPFSIVLKLIPSDSNTFLQMLTGFTDFTSITTGLRRILILLIIIVYLFAPTLSYLVAMRTTSIMEVFSLEPWLWLTEERQADLASFYCCLLGGIFLFCLIFALPLLVLCVLTYKISPSVCMLLINFVVMLPCLIYPIIVGRLSGAFISGETEIEIELDQQQLLNAESEEVEIAQAIASQTVEEKKPVAQVPQTPINPKPPVTIINTTMTGKPQFADIVSKVDNLNPTDLIKATINIEQQVKTLPNNIYLIIELTLLYRKAKRMDDCLKTASTAIQVALNNGAAEFAITLYREFHTQRTQLKLDESYLERLGHVLSMQHNYLDAGWCVYFASTLANDSDNLNGQKKLLSVADTARRNGYNKDALALYEFFISKFPTSTLLEYAERAAADEQRKLNK